MSVYAKEDPGHLDEALRSSLDDQSVRPAELVLVEDGPLTPELYGVIEKYRQRHTVVSVKLPQNSGLGNALNEGLGKCRYEWVARMDGDDIAKPGRFEKQTAVIKSHPGIDIVGSWVDEFQTDTDTVAFIQKMPETHRQICDYAKRRCPFGHPTVMFRKEAVTSAGGYPDFPGIEDYPLWVRMLNDGRQAYNIQESLLFFRSSPKTYQRRGGFGYLIKEIHLQREFKRIGFISGREMLVNISVRAIFRLIPNGLRAYMYKKFLRAHHE